MMLMAVAATMLATQRAAAAEVAAPAGALAPNTTFVMWAEVEAFNKQDVGDAMQAVIAAAPDSERERMNADYTEQMAKMQPMFDAAAELKQDGVISGVVSMTPQDDPNARPQSQLFLQTQPGSDPKAAVNKAARAVNAWMKDNNPDEAIDDAELDAKLEQAKYTKINDQWYAVEIDDEQVAPLPEAASAADPAPFVEAMNQEEGAPVRFAFVMTDQIKQQLQQAAANPNAAMMAGIMQPLTDMQTATGGLWLGAEPKLRVSMNFNEQASAQMFKTSADGIIQFMGQMMAMQGAQQNPEAAGQGPDMEKIQAVMPLMMLDQEGAVISKTLDITLLEKLTEAGIPWYQDN
jgi:hypothetical protein